MNNLNKGAHVSPNIQSDSDVYELENTICDPQQKIEQCMHSVYDWSGKIVLDIGCGTGFHLPRFAKTASHVFGVEPHDDSRIKAMERISSKKLKNISISKGTAESIPLKSGLVDFACARFSYFWGKGCEEGLKEVERILSKDSCFFMIDNNLEKGTFGPWVKESFNFPDSKQQEIESFWKNQGFKLQEIKSCWQFKSRDDLEKVLSIEFPEKVYNQIITKHDSLRIDYAFNLYYKIYSS